MHTTALLPLSGLSMVLDRFGALFVAVSAVVGICAMVFRLGYHGHGLSSRTASCVLPLFVTTLLLVPAASNVTTFLFLWELMAVTSLLLVLVDHRRRSEVASAGQWYAVMTQFGAAALLVGLVLLATHTGSQSFAAIAARSAHLPAWVRGSAFVLAVVGFGSKAGMVPLHVWLPRAHPEAPGPVSALMSAAMVNLGIYGIVRVGDGLLGGGPAWWWLLVMALGALSALFGSLHSATSSDLKRLLAYSTTDNVGLMLLGVGASGLFASTGHRALALVALVAALLHVVFHAVFKGSLFLSASSLQQATGTRDLDRMGGLLRRMPVTGTLFLVGGLAMAALPVLCGFVSEWLLLQAMLHGLPSTGSRHRRGHAHRRRRPRPHRGADRPDLRQGHRHRAARPAAEHRRQPKRTRSARRCGSGPAPWPGSAWSSVWPPSWSSPPWSTPPAASLGPASPTPWWLGWQVGLAGVHGVLAPGLLASALLSPSPWSPGLDACSNPPRSPHRGVGVRPGAPDGHAWSTRPPRSVSR